MMTEMTGTGWPIEKLPGRWIQLLLGLVAMMAISSPQYVWTLFRKPLQGALTTDLATIQVTFSVLVVLQTLFSPVQGYLTEKFGPRLLVSFGAILTGAGWVLSSQVDSVPLLYLTYGGMGGLGTGIIYVGVVGLMVKWFPKHRGFATGVVAAGYGFGAIATSIPIADMIDKSGYQQTLIVYGIGIGLIGLLAAQGLREPPKPVLAAGDGILSSGSGYGWREMLKTPIFWLMFGMMTMMSTGGLMVISQFSAFADDFGVSKTLVFGTAALPLALTIDRFTNGLTRPFFGWVSDNIGRENTMGLAFILEACAIAALAYFSDNAVALVLLSGLVFFGWGEIFSLFPSTLTDTFGTAHATTNYGFLYIAQGVGSVLGGPVAAMIHESFHSWTPVFALIIGMDMVTGLLALFALKPMRTRWAKSH